MMEVEECGGVAGQLSQLVVSYNGTLSGANVGYLCICYKKSSLSSDDRNCVICHSCGGES